MIEVDSQLLMLTRHYHKQTPKQLIEFDSQWLKLTPILNADRHYHKQTLKQLIEFDSQWFPFLMLTDTTTSRHQSSWLKLIPNWGAGSTTDSGACVPRSKTHRNRRATNGQWMVRETNHPCPSLSIWSTMIYRGSWTRFWCTTSYSLFLFPKSQNKQKN